ncbi:hypothetical protein DPMN_154904 [Dreissena polymorpha]|uniref:Uncharacterized protein n=1 Tax=Dreissena polymorpha TaxID=45954 RepID=A0A9D4FSR8_DREPO|nr:hypothetical protein DPMN_154904 [Dreissena polymorpha]
MPVSYTRWSNQWRELERHDVALHVSSVPPSNKECVTIGNGRNMTHPAVIKC